MAIFNSYVKLPEGTNCPILYQSVMRSGVPYVQSSPPFTDWWIWKASDSHGMEMPWYEDNTPFHCNIYIQYIHFFAYGSHVFTRWFLRTWWLARILTGIQPQPPEANQGIPYVFSWVEGDSVKCQCLWLITICLHMLTGWWFATFGLFFPSYWQSHHPSWRSHIFPRGRAQPPPSWYPDPLGSRLATMTQRIHAIPQRHGLSIYFDRSCCIHVYMVGCISIYWE